MLRTFHSNITGTLYPMPHWLEIKVLFTDKMTLPPFFLDKRDNIIQFLSALHPFSPTFWMAFCPFRSSDPWHSFLGKADAGKRSREMHFRWPKVARIQPNVKKYLLYSHYPLVAIFRSPSGVMFFRDLFVMRRNSKVKILVTYLWGLGVHLAQVDLWKQRSPLLLEAFHNMRVLCLMQSYA